jgi:hypothetical protein
MEGREIGSLAMSTRGVASYAQVGAAAQSPPATLASAITSFETVNQRPANCSPKHIRSQSLSAGRFRPAPTRSRTRHRPVLRSVASTTFLAVPKRSLTTSAIA